ncbi:sodium:solute symporter [Winogradskyella echinorum]|uniref:Sodium:solute symporter n=1 Tax=Winogradskyella echinorum TaxID=538189 RepID=A0ABR6Y391_9FLAO|nr:sodium:solute symporter [Winogradskyella echinorum]MBC3846693.1 sodium:solute symporter [Winogradskyella echinorum]MBC5751041.1 sodium:solute symporter [Winogradskyella echinorum]
MQTLDWRDWLVLIATLLAIVGYGTWKTRGRKNAQDYIKGGNTTKWWTIGLSVMATQASAITFLSTTGQAFSDGMGFVQFYFGLPIAMVIICLVFIPLYHRLKVYTAYEFLENRFDLKTRSLTAILFLIQRGLAAGITIFAPAIILSVVLGWNIVTLNIVIGVLVIIYTVSGGTKAVTVTQKQQMFVIFAGMLAALFIIINLIPDDVSFRDAIDIAGATGKMEVLDFSFDLENRYTVWTGLIGGTFLMLSYFGTDQSQVQRYLSGKSMKEMQMGLLFNGLLKVPMQFFILLVGVMVFVFYQFNPSPLNFIDASTQTVLASEYGDDYRTLQEKQKTLFLDKQTLSLDYSKNQNLKTKQQLFTIDSIEKSYRLKSKFLIKKAVDSEYSSKYNELQQEVEQLKSNAESEAYIEKSAELTALYKDAAKDTQTNDRDYMFIRFILNNLPTGLIGLLLAVILSAAMSSTASEINALATITSIDLYGRNVSGEKDDAHMVKMTKWFTLGWGIIAIIIACFANLAENLIQLVNIIGSIFYGNVLGIFLLAFFFKHIKGNAVFTGALITQTIVVLGWWFDWMPYLWLNLFGCVLVIVIAHILQVALPKKELTDVNKSY